MTLGKKKKPPEVDQPGSQNETEKDANYLFNK